MPTTPLIDRLGLAAGALLLLAGTAAAKPGLAASTVNLRAEANTTSAVVTKIPAGAPVDVGDCHDGWCAVTYQDKSGFSIATALDTSGKPHSAVRRAAVGPAAAVAPPPGYIAPGPAVVYAPGPYYYGGPYAGPYWGYRRWGYGGYRWGYGGYRYGWRRW